MKQVIVIGVGFGGLHAARALAEQELAVLLLDRNNYHLFQPLLYQVATAGLEQESITFPIRAVTRRWQNMRFRRTAVQQIDLDQRQVITSDETLTYDYLVLASGSETIFFGLDSVQRHAFDLKQLRDAVTLRNHILTQFERAAYENDPARRQALLTFVIVGGGPTGLSLLAHWRS